MLDRTMSLHTAAPATLDGRKRAFQKRTRACRIKTLACRKMSEASSSIGRQRVGAF